MYIGPPLKKSLDPQEVKRFLQKKHAWGATWSYDFDYDEEGPWYRCVCDASDYDESKIKSKNARHNVRRSLKRCVVRPIDHLWLADNGYEVYVNAASRYTESRLETKKEFKRRLRSQFNVSGSEAFGVFVSEKLAAYVTLFVCGQGVLGDTARFDTAYSNAYPMYALYYTIARHYLKEKGYKKLDCGSRPLLHETNIGDFLLRLGYRKSYCRLGVYFTRPVRVVLGLARIFGRVCKLIFPSRYYTILDGLLLAQDIAKATSAEVSCT